MTPRRTSGIRLLGTDLDGTLLDPFGQVSKLNIEAIDKARGRGMTIIATTARSIRSVRKISSNAGLGPLAVCQNGAAVYDLTKDSLVLHDPLPLDNAVQIIEDLRKSAPGMIFAVEKLERFIPEKSFFVSAIPGLTEVPVSDILDEIDGPITKIICRHPGVSHAELIRLGRSRCGHLADSTSAGGDWVDFQSIGTSKATGLEYAAKLLNVLQSETAAIGDQHNDVSMLRWASYSAAPDNAHEAAKKAADWIAPSNVNGGVAAFIELLLERSSDGNANPAK